MIHAFGNHALRLFLFALAVGKIGFLFPQPSALPDTAWKHRLPFNRLAALPQRPHERPVEVFMPGSSPQEPYIQTALLSESGPLGDNASPMLQRLRLRAAQLGADALLVQDFSPFTLTGDYSSTAYLAVTALAVTYPRNLPDLTQHLWVRRWEVWDSTGAVVSVKKELFYQGEVLMSAGAFSQDLMTLFRQTSPTEVVYTPTGEKAYNSQLYPTERKVGDITYKFVLDRTKVGQDSIKSIHIFYAPSIPSTSPERIVSFNPLVPGYDTQHRVYSLTAPTQLYGKVAAVVAYTTGCDWSSITYWKLGKDDLPRHQIFRVGYVRPTAADLEALIAGDKVKIPTPALPAGTP